MAAKAFKLLALLLAFTAVVHALDEKLERKERSIDNQEISDLISHDESNSADPLEYSIKVTMVNHGETSAKVHQRFLFPDGAEVKSFSLAEPNGGSRKKRSSENQRLTQWDGGSINLNAASEKDAEMSYINHPTEVLDTNSKTFHRLSTSLTVTEGDVVGGEIFSPNYLLSYPNGADLTWLIAYPEGNVVRLEMEDFSMEECCDHLIVYDGFNKSHSVLATFDGEYYASPDNIVVGTKQAMFLRFTSDCLETSRGFRAKYINVKQIATTSSPVMSCGSVELTNGNSGNIYSPNYPGTYDTDMNCTWSVQTYYGTRVKFVLYNFSISYDDDLTIYDGTPSNPGSRIVRLSGSYYSGYTINTNSYRAFVVFTSGYSTNYYNKFVISYIGVDYSPTTSTQEYTTPVYYNPPICSGNTENNDIYSTFVTRSPGYYSPGSYPNDMTCVWTYTARAGRFLRFEAVTFSTEYGFDYVRIYSNHEQNYQNLVAEISGYLDPHTYIAFVDGIVATMSFTTDGSVTDYGFYIKVYPVNEAPPTAEPLIETTASFENTCYTNYYSGYYGYISSPNYPSNYDNNMNCTTYITAPYDTIIALTVQSFNLSYGDYVTVYDGYSGNNLGTFSGYYYYGEIWYFYTRYLKVEFYSDSYDTSYGYQVRYNAIDDNSYYTTIAPSSRECGRQMPNNYGTIYSPNYPSNYDNDLDCQWTVQVYPDMYVLFTFDSFYLESCCDYVAFFEGSPENSHGKVAQYNGYMNSGFQVLVEYYKAYVTFHTDYSVTYSGFMISYSPVNSSFVSENNSTRSYDLEDSSYVAHFRGSRPMEDLREVHNPHSGPIALGKDLWEGSKKRPHGDKNKEKQQSPALKDKVGDEIIN